jgi:hypothetical protein
MKQKTRRHWSMGLRYRVMDRQAYRTGCRICRKFQIVTVSVLAWASLMIFQNGLIRRIDVGLNMYHYRNDKFGRHLTDYWSIY